jgi:hypothetical protein
VGNKKNLVTGPSPVAVTQEEAKAWCENVRPSNPVPYVLLGTPDSRGIKPLLSQLVAAIEEYDWQPEDELTVPPVVSEAHLPDEKEPEDDDKPLINSERKCVAVCGITCVIS